MLAKVRHAACYYVSSGKRHPTSPLFPASGQATGSFNGLHPKSKFLAANHENSHQRGVCGINDLGDG